MHWLSFLIGVLVGCLICWLLDYFVCRPRRKATEEALRTQLEHCKEESASLRAQLTNLQEVQARLDEANAEIATLKAQLAQAAVAVPPTQVDDLTLIEGIGPKINALLNQNGIYTFAQLAAMTVERLHAILEAGGPRFRLADPKTWPEQAQLARDGKWDALQALQDRLKGGREV